MHIWKMNWLQMIEGPIERLSAALTIRQRKRKSEDDPLGEKVAGHAGRMDIEAEISQVLLEDWQDAMRGKTESGCERSWRKCVGSRTRLGANQVEQDW